MSTEFTSKSLPFLTSRMAIMNTCAARGTRDMNGGAQCPNNHHKVKKIYTHLCLPLVHEDLTGHLRKVSRRTETLHLSPLPLCPPKG